jgi:hypothetical protein
LVLQVAVEVKSLEVSLLLWVPPPPSDRLWVSCLQQPKVSLTVTPIVTQAVPQLLEGFQVSEWIKQAESRAYDCSGFVLVLISCTMLGVPADNSIASCSTITNTAIKSCMLCTCITLCG